jgi:hypothetical protein
MFNHHGLTTPDMFNCMFYAVLLASFMMHCWQVYDALLASL